MFQLSPDKTNRTRIKDNMNATNAETGQSQHLQKRALPSEFAGKQRRLRLVNVPLQASDADLKLPRSLPLADFARS